MDAIEDHPDYWKTEWAKVSYVRNGLEGEAYNIVEERATRDSPVCYASYRELIRDLDRVYMPVDMVVEAQMKMKAPGFRMKSTERFTAFYGRWLSASAPLQLSNAMKRISLNDYISLRLKEKLVGKVFTTCPELVEYLMQVDTGLAEIDARQQRQSAPKTTTGNSYRASASTPKPQFRIAEEVRDVCGKKGLCFRCGDPDHQSKNCKNSRLTEWQLKKKIQYPETTSRSAKVNFTTIEDCGEDGESNSDAESLSDANSAPSDTEN